MGKAVVIKNKLLSKFVRLEQLDGAKSENMNLKNQLLKISCKKGKYPQIFIKDENNQIRFIGLDSDINFLIQSGNFDKVFSLCMDGSNAPNLDNHKEAMRYKKLAEQWYGAKNLIKAQKFALKSLQFEDAEDVKQILDKIKTQFNENDINYNQIYADDNMQLDEEKNEVPIIQTNDNRNLPQQSPKKKNKEKQKSKECVCVD